MRGILMVDADSFFFAVLLFGHPVELFSIPKKDEEKRYYPPEHKNHSKNDLYTNMEHPVFPYLPDTAWLALR